jgi:hypothetical protein
VIGTLVPVEQSTGTGGLVGDKQTNICTELKFVPLACPVPPTLDCPAKGVVSAGTDCAFDAIAVTAKVKKAITRVFLILINLLGTLSRRGIWVPLKKMRVRLGLYVRPKGVAISRSQVCGKSSRSYVRTVKLRMPMVKPTIWVMNAVRSGDMTDASQDGGFPANV